MENTASHWFARNWTIITALVIVALLGWYAYNRQRNLIGGQTDPHGCLAAAGYSWCDAKQKCLRPFEETCTAAASKTAVFNCSGGKFITATFYPGAENDKSVDLVLSDGRKMSVPHAISGSGARYANADESFVFWNKGDTAFITENGTTTYDGCVTSSQ